MKISLTYSEIVRFLRSQCKITIFVSLGIGILIQLSGANGDVEKLTFFNLIFAFWMGITMVVDWFEKDEKYIQRLCEIKLTNGGVSVWKVLRSRTVVIFFMATIHASILLALSSILFLNHGTIPSKTSAALNKIRYGEANIEEWGDDDSEYCQRNSDEFYREINYDEKQRIANTYQLVKDEGKWVEFEKLSLFSYFRRWYSFFLASFMGGWLGVVLFSTLKSGWPSKVIPFITAFQIMFAKLTADPESKLFGPLKYLMGEYIWWEPVHLLSLLTPIRYLVVISNSNGLIDLFLSWDSIVLYLMISTCFLISGIMMSRKLSNYVRPNITL
jgi:hypothetical protein